MPTIKLLVLIAVTVVPTDPGGSKDVVEPFGARTNPWLTPAESIEYPATLPNELIPAMEMLVAPETSNEVKPVLPARRKPWLRFDASV